jgi:hypothetical protein
LAQIDIPAYFGAAAECSTPRDWPSGGGTQMAALGEELSQDDNQLVTKADLRASVAELRAELNDLKAWMLTRLIAMFGIALGIIALMIRFLSPAAGIQ